MRIYLFLNDKILKFLIPSKVSGSFSFDENLESEDKLINIDAKGPDWYIRSTAKSSIILNGTTVDEKKIEKNSYYTIKKNNIEYLIYIEDIFDNSFSAYSYQDNMNLIIGNMEKCNININNNYINGFVANIVKNNGQVLLKVLGEKLYFNDKFIPSSENIYYIKNGDVINIYGFKLIFYSNFFIMNNPNGTINVAENIRKHGFGELKKIQDLEFSDVNLYNQSDYFSKSPRIRRIIETKKVTISPPPSLPGENKMPMILTMGPMIVMVITTGITLTNTITKIVSGETTLNKCWPQLVSSALMIISMLLWPSLTRLFNKKIAKARKKEINEKYSTYLAEKEKELKEENRLQKDILIENLLPVEDCIRIINAGKINFWDKRIEQNDFLEVRLGKGNALLDIDIDFQKEDFSIDVSELKKQAEDLIEKYKYVMDVPIRYSFYKSKITNIMGMPEKYYGMMNNIILQLITFYSYDDVKIVLFTNQENSNRWEFLKYLNHCFSDDKSIRFFSSDAENSRKLCEYLESQLQERIARSNDGLQFFKPYYVIITDDYTQIRRNQFIKAITEIDVNLGFSLIILENYMSKVPSKCNNFINLMGTDSTILRNAFDKQEQLSFKDEINYQIDMMQISKKLSNIPIEFVNSNRYLPESVTFLEMEKVGKVEQLNILNRWDTNDSTASLKAEVGVDEDGNLMYLDLHEKYHGPHGLIAGMTGSGKSEFIITYILSMAINYSPDDVAFILIDYKGGGLAFAFENKTTGVSLPHLAGTITNLDKAEMSRTLVSIDSEIKRRQKMFNEARDKLGESTIDIYKYQKFYKEGMVEEPIPHLFIICDEFAELKSQQPEFMDNLISVARIGRSLGVHLILATQKPSGVVNDQIWSNTKFRVCLKVQSESDSKEMLKRPEAASLKQTGRFYLQVGFDEYFALGQSGWCGAKYYPSERIIKKVDKSVKFIDEMGIVVKSIEASKNIKIQPQGEQLSAIMQNIIEVSNITNKRVKKLWLENIEPIILIDNLENKYNFKANSYNVCAIIGEYDSPETQEQGLLTYYANKDGNILIFGNDEVEKEKLLSSIIYSVCKNYSPNEINMYVIDYGSEQLRMFTEFPQVGGMVFEGENELFSSLFRLIDEIIKERKKMLIPYGGSIESYNQKNKEKLSTIFLILNNYEGMCEYYNNLTVTLTSLARDCSRYGIILIMTCNVISSIGRRLLQSFDTKYALHMNDSSDYYSIFLEKIKSKPRDIEGRGLALFNGVHEFQTASIVEDQSNLNDYLINESKKAREKYTVKAQPIPSLPDKVTLDFVKNSIKDLSKVPIGVSRNNLNVVTYNFSYFKLTSIASNKLEYINTFMRSLIDVFLQINNLVIVFMDPFKYIPSLKEKKLEKSVLNYFDDNFEKVIEKSIELEQKKNNPNYKMLYIFYGIEKIKSQVAIDKMKKLFDEINKSSISLAIACDSAKNLTAIEYESWYSSLRVKTDGIWIGKGFAEQSVLKVGKITKEMSEPYTNNYGFYLSESSSELIKLLEFYDMKDGEDNGE